MTGRRNAKTPADAYEGPSLQELLQDDSDGGGDSYDGVDSGAIAALVSVVVQLGGMVTFYFDSGNHRLCYSVRLGTEKRSYQADTAAEIELAIRSTTNRLTPALRKVGGKPPKVRDSKA